LFTLNESGEYREEIKKSRFICLVEPVFSESEAQLFIEEHSDLAARHNCWAWKIGNDYRFNDDGEPSGTAGKPIYNAIEYADLTNVVILVIRWFGGIKLGTGGLCRAYGGVASSCLKELDKVEIKKMLSLQLAIPFEFTNSIYQLIDKEELTKENEGYGQFGLSMTIKVEEKEYPRILELITEFSKGRILSEILSK
jgi:uncharacterized YigZ family protein